MDDAKLFPVYLVPTKQAKWKDLAILFTEAMADFLSVDWLESASAQPKIPDDFIPKWCAIIKGEPGRVEITHNSDGRADEDFNMNESSSGRG